ncbi:MAG: hypothetical protein WA400_15305 [Silvibacterium sp.]
MRIPAMRFLDASFSALVLCALCVPLTARAQQSQIPIPPPPTIPGVSPTGPESDPATRRMAEQMGLRRNTERQKQIVADTARLLQLAQKLNDEVSKTNQNMLSIPVVKEAEEIEKLAKTIKDKMRDGT